MFWKTTRVALLFAVGSVTMVQSSVHADALEALKVGDVEVGGEIGRRIDVTVDNNLMVLDVEQDFLQPFRERNRQGGYIGLGKLIDALVRFAVYTDDPDVKARKESTVAAIIATQEDDGYIGMFVPERRLWSLWDIHEMAYLIYGLTMDYRFFREQASLDAARKAAGYIVDHWNAEPEKSPGGEITEYMAVTGLENALLALYGATDDQRYLDFCVGRRDLADWEGPIVLGRWGKIQGHAYAYLCRSLAQLRLNRIQGKQGLSPASESASETGLSLFPVQRAMDFMTQQDGMAVIGTCGQHECWHDTQEGAANLGETCATAYLVRMLDELLRIEGNQIYGDLMERGIYNALFAAQSPDGRRIRYYVPFEGPRQYFDGDTYCCPCNYRRIIAELPSMIYYRDKEGLTVNLYTPSSATFDVAGTKVCITQETNYPSDGKITIHVEPEKPVHFVVKLRTPRWSRNFEYALNGKATQLSLQEGEVMGAFVGIGWNYKPGDVVTLDLPMELQMVKGRRAQAGRVAIMRGPVVYCLNPERNPQLVGEDLRLITIDPGHARRPDPRR